MFFETVYKGGNYSVNPRNLDYFRLLRHTSISIVLHYYNMDKIERTLLYRFITAFTSENTLGLIVTYFWLLLFRYRPNGWFDTLLESLFKPMIRVSVQLQSVIVELAST